VLVHEVIPRQECVSQEDSSLALCCCWRRAHMRCCSLIRARYLPCRCRIMLIFAYMIAQCRCGYAQSVMPQMLLRFMVDAVTKMYERRPLLCLRCSPAAHYTRAREAFIPAAFTFLLPRRLLLLCFHFRLCSTGQRPTSTPPCARVQEACLYSPAYAAFREKTAGLAHFARYAMKRKRREIL